MSRVDRPVRVDAHHHVWDLDRRPQPWTVDLPILRRSFGFDELAPQLRRAAVDATVVVHTVDSPEETLELLALAAAEPLVAGVVGWFDLEADDLVDELTSARERPGGDRLVGARHQLQVEPDPGWLDRPAVRRGLRTLATSGLAYDVVVGPEQLARVARVVADLPDLRFVLDHAGKPPVARGDLADWSRDLRGLARLDNLAVKLSGLVTEASWEAWSVDDLRPVADTVLGAFGPARVMVGSDWPVCLLAHAPYDVVMATTEELLAGLAPDDRAAVWGGTATDVYGLVVA